MDVISALLESFVRQARMVDSLAGLMTEGNRHAKTDPEGWSLDYHLCHIHEVRYWWLQNVSPEDAGVLRDVFDGETEQPIESLDEIRACLQHSAQIVHDVAARLISDGTQRVGSYDHPVFFLQHMLWHDGYHYGLANLCLRLAGEAPSEEWEELNVWGKWRDPETW